MRANGETTKVDCETGRLTAVQIWPKDLTQKMLNLEFLLLRIKFIRAEGFIPCMITTRDNILPSLADYR